MNAVGVRVMVIDGAVTVNDTGTETGVAPVAVKVMVPVWVPTANAPVVAVSDMEPLPLPAVEESANHERVSLALQLRVPPPVLLRLRV